MLAGSAGAQGKVTLAQRRMHIRKRLQRANDHGAHTEAERKPGSHNEDGAGPLRFAGVIAGPKQDQGDEDGKRTAGKRGKQDAIFMHDAARFFPLRRRPAWLRAWCGGRYLDPSGVKRGHTSAAGDRARFGLVLKLRLPG